MKPRIALCMEYSMGQQGGTEVLVRALAENLAEHFDIVLVTNDTAQTLAASGFKGSIVRHIRWDPARLGRGQSTALAQQLNDERVQLAHFHFGGTFVWGNRWFGRCPIHHV